MYGTTDSVPTDSNQVSTRLSQEKIEDTPVLERKITTLPLLNSSVRLSQTTGDLFLNETLFVINGTGRRQTTYQLDNTTANDMWGRQSTIAGLPFSAVQEFTVYTNASFGGVGLERRHRREHRDPIGIERLARRLRRNGQSGVLQCQHSANHETGAGDAGPRQRYAVRPYREGQDLLHGVGAVHESESASRHHFPGRSRRPLQRHLWTDVISGASGPAVEPEQPAHVARKFRSLQRHQSAGCGEWRHSTHGRSRVHA